MPRKNSHLHKYRKAKIGKNRDYVVYACTLPGCTHYINPVLTVGKMALCNRCNEPFEMPVQIWTRIALKPHCKNCTVSDKPKVAEQVLDEFLKGLNLK